MATVKFVTAKPGMYQLAVGLFLNQDDANPAYRLGIQGKTIANWYVLREQLLVK